jgi:hypothetical protein
MARASMRDGLEVLLVVVNTCAPDERNTLFTSSPMLTFAPENLG